MDNMENIDKEKNEPSAQAGSMDSPEILESPESQETGDDLTGALAATLQSLNQSIGLMEQIVQKLEAGDSDWEESVQMLAEANDLAMESSQKLDRVVQDVVYGAEDDDRPEQDPVPGI